MRWFVWILAGIAIVGALVVIVGYSLPKASGSDVTITEDGEVHHPFFRFMSRFVFGHTATLDEFVRNLEARAR